MSELIRSFDQLWLHIFHSAFSSLFCNPFCSCGSLIHKTANQGAGVTCINAFIYISTSTTVDIFTYDSYINEVTSQHMYRIKVPLFNESMKVNQLSLAWPIQSQTASTWHAHLYLCSIIFPNQTKCLGCFSESIQSMNQEIFGLNIMGTLNELIYIPIGP